jgi:DinB superfamily
MGASPIQAAYLPFADTLRSGGFREPEAGWNAGQIGAHISLSNELFSDLAERLHDGDDVSFDNSAVVDDASLRTYAAGLGDVGDLADAVQASAARLAHAYERLTPEERTRPIPVTMWHDGQIVRDRPMPLGDLITGNGEGHLAMHYEQLKALRAR